MLCQVITYLDSPKLLHMDKQEVRRANLLTWTGKNTIPAKEKSYFSQLLNGTASFGERAARRIEKQYGMPDGWLDDKNAAIAYIKHISRPPGSASDFDVSDIPTPAIKEIEVERRKAHYGRRSSDLLRDVSDDEDFEIPQLMAAGGSMGSGIVLRDQPGEIKGWRVTPDWLSKNVKNHTGVNNLCIVTGFGDSMRPLYNPGDPLLVDSGVHTVEFDSIYFFRIGNEGFIKRLQRIPGQGLVAISENKSYRDWVITPDMDFEVFARVLTVWCGSHF